MKQILSLGAGVQSTVVSLMAARGELPNMPDYAIFADTGAEPESVYQHLDWLEKQLPFPVHRVMEKDGLYANIVESVKGGRFAGAPFITESKSGGGMLRRQCTREFKIMPIEREIRRLLGYKKGQRIKGLQVRQWFGISWDEIGRMKEPRTPWIEGYWPLIDLRMTRRDCLKWMEENGYPEPPRSACIFCPYHSDAEWRRMKNDEPKEFAKAVEIDELIRNGVRGTKEKLYLHRSMNPLHDVDFRNEEDMGQLNFFNNECEGMCGV